MLKRKGEENVSQYILIVGIVVLVSLMILFASSMLSGVDLPEDQEQEIEGTEDDITEKLAELSDMCYIQADRGRMGDHKGCYIVSLYHTEDDNLIINEDDIKGLLEELPEDNFSTDSDPIFNVEEVVISYYPDGFEEDDDIVVIR